MKSECVALLLALSLCAGALGAKIQVNDDAPGDPGPHDPNVSDLKEDGTTEHPFDSIQEAIDAANDTILRGVIIFKGTEDPNCLLQGFKIQNHDCGGILGNKTRATISHCIISGNGPCGATVLKDVYGRVTNCLIVDNTTFYGCGVLPVVSGCPELINCTIANNLSNLEINGDGVPPGGYIRLWNCIIYGNQGTFSYRVNRSTTAKQIAYCLIEGVDPRGDPFWGGSDATVWSADPCFVQTGHWEQPSAGAKPATRAGSPTPTLLRSTLVEGDYHLRSEGWRWSVQPVHHSHWYFDSATSRAIDAGDPMDSLGEEPERVPQDPEGEWGFNHAIDLGAYGGTAHASLAPTWAFPTPGSRQDLLAPGVGAVDLRDFWPLRVGDFWLVHNPQGAARQVRVTSQLYIVYDKYYPVTFWSFEATNAPDWAAKLYCLYFNHIFYTTQDRAALDALPQISSRFQAQYPQYLVVGATIQVLYDPFVERTAQPRPVVITRGTLAEVLTGTSMNLTQFLPGAWPDVIALKEKTQDGPVGAPIAIFARGFGPLWIAGQPVEGAYIHGTAFGNASVPTRATRGGG